MCHPTTCHICGKTTWKGCGNHVEAVKARVPVGQWCAGHPERHGHDGARDSSWLRRVRRR